MQRTGTDGQASIELFQDSLEWRLTALMSLFAYSLFVRLYLTDVFVKTINLCPSVA